MGLKVPATGSARIDCSLSVIGGKPSALGVALLAAGTGVDSPRVLLDACAAGPAATVVDGESLTFSWPVWPDVAEPVLLMYSIAATLRRAWVRWSSGSSRATPARHRWRKLIRRPLEDWS